MGTDTSAPRLVVGYDGSPSARRALEYALERAGQSGRVFVVHAFGPPPDWLGAPRYQEILDRHQERGHQLESELEGRGVEVELIAGEPAEAITSVAETRQADEIVVGSRGFGRARAALGSTSHDLLHRAPCPVVVMPDDG